MNTDLASMIASLPFAFIDAQEAGVLAKMADRAAAGNGRIADVLIARLAEDAAVHDLAGNCVKANVIRDAIDAVAAFSP
jgi:hypothetical protein